MRMDTVTMITKTIEAHELAHLKLELEAIKTKLNTSEHIQQQQIYTKTYPCSIIKMTQANPSKEKISIAAKTKFLT
jgi:hypothetical protein